MGAPSKEGAALRLEVEQAVLAAAEKLGVEGIDTAGIVRQCTARGVADSTLFRWCREIIQSGKPGQHAARLVKAAAAGRAARSDDPAASVATELVEKLPIVVKVDEVIGTAAGGKAVGVIERLQGLMVDVEMLIRHAKSEDG